MNIVVDSDDFELFWVNSKVIESLWEGTDKYCDPKCVTFDEREPSKRMPHNSWFMYSSESMKIAFKAPKIGIENNPNLNSKICIHNGRHRLRWMMSLSLAKIPVGISKHEIAEFSKLKLDMLKILPDEIIPNELINAVNKKYENL